MCALVDVVVLLHLLPHCGAVSQMPGAVCQLSAVSSEREDSEGYLKWRGSYITLGCHTLGVDQSAAP